MIIILIILVIRIHHINLTRLLKNNAPFIKFDMDERLCITFTSLNYDNSTKIKKTIAVDKDNKDKVKDLREKNKCKSRQTIQLIVA